MRDRITSVSILDFSCLFCLPVIRSDPNVIRKFGDETSFKYKQTFIPKLFSLSFVL
jgi:hypothetical protein